MKQLMLILLMVFILSGVALAQVAYRPAHPKPTPTRILSTATPLPAPEAYTTQVDVTYVSRPGYKGYLCHYWGTPATQWSACHPVTDSRDGVTIVYGYSLPAR